jgi:hypothetical protein
VAIILFILKKNLIRGSLLCLSMLPLILMEVVSERPKTSESVYIIQTTTYVYTKGKVVSPRALAQVAKGGVGVGLRFISYKKKEKKVGLKLG